jgi:hypothetical protein
VLPISTLVFRSQGLQVAVVQNGVASLRSVTAGHDFGEQIEIASGLKGDESVIANPPDSIVSGEKVNVVTTTAGGGQ